MTLQALQDQINSTLQKHYNADLGIELQENKTQGEGDYTIVLFALAKTLQTNPADLGNQIGELLRNNIPSITGYEVVKGFLNLSLSDHFFISALQSYQPTASAESTSARPVMVEYSSPNTNKPLHLGHVRNNLLGFSIAKILEAAGETVIKAQIINDRGIHICKSMLAWQEMGDGCTPFSANAKGDKLVGDYYVKFDKKYKEEIQQLVAAGTAEEEAKKNAPSIIAAQNMLQHWEQEDPAVRKLWQTMNQWVYDGFQQTYDRLGVSFDQVQYESETYLLGKDIIMEGLERGIFYRHQDGSIRVDLSDVGLDEKVLLRSDGTSVYITQDLGTAVQRFEKNNLQKLIYTVGNEQDYHFQVLFAILKKLGYAWADQLYHLSYGMVELPQGKMKSREGTVVDAVDLMQQMYETAKAKAQELGKLDGLTEEEKEQSYEKVGMAALKYFILKVDPKKKMLFDPQKSVDVEGNTGPFLQYTYARIQSVLRKANDGVDDELNVDGVSPNAQEKQLLQQLIALPAVIQKAADTLNPAQVANYIYDLVKSYNSFYQNNPILSQEDPAVRSFRLRLSARVGETIRYGLSLLGIEVLDRM